ncbi:MAG: amidohydrolase [Acidobacteriota bacterium]
MLRRRLLQRIERRRSQILELSRHLYLHPELSGEERHACALLSGILAREGFEVERGVGRLETAFTARLQHGRGAHVGVLLEYDALPEIGHGCGHNMIAACGLGAGLALADLRRNWRGTLTLVGTPAEETFGGKAVLANAGLFDGMDAALIVHGGHENRVFTDSLACGSFEVVFRGRAAHAVVCPERGVNALDALVQVYVGIDMMRKSLGREIQMVGVILEGGVRPNLVPDRAVGRFSIRAPTHLLRRAAHRRFVHMVQAVSRATGTRFSIRATDVPYLQMRTNEVLAHTARAHFERLGRHTNDAPRTARGSIDMGNVSQRAPALHLYVDLGAGSATPHTRRFARATQSAGGRRATLAAAQVLALTSLDILARPELRRAARAEFLRGCDAGRRCVLPKKSRTVGGAAGSGAWGGA